MKQFKYLLLLFSIHFLISCNKDIIMPQNDAQLLSISDKSKLIYLNENQIFNNRNQILGHFENDTLINLHNQKIAYVKENKIYNMTNQYLGEVIDGHLKSLNGENIAILEGENIQKQVWLGAYFYFL